MSLDEKPEISKPEKKKKKDVQFVTKNLDYLSILVDVANYFV